MGFNSTKAKTMVESSRNFEVPPLQGPSLINVSCSSQITERVKDYIFLGVTIDENFQKFPSKNYSTSKLGYLESCKIIQTFQCTYISKAIY